MVTENIMVSVLITFYNQEEYVDKALKSVLEQKTEFDIEILIGDDGSSDNTINVINKWIEKYPEKIKVYIMERDGKKYISGFRASKNRLNLLKYVSGKYFIFLDGDDYFTDSRKLQKQVELLEDRNNQDCIACGHDIDMLFPDGSKKVMRNVGLSEGKVGASQYWRKYYFHTDTLLVRSEVISKIDTKLLENNFNDNLITYAIIQYGKIYYIPESMAVYLQTGDGVWTSGKKVLNLIRNMYLYDLANQINPKMKSATTRRLAESWLELIINRKFIHSSDLQPLLKEAEDKKMECSLNWIRYNEKKCSDKVKWLLYSFIEARHIIPIKACIKIYHAMGLYALKEFVVNRKKKSEGR